MNGWRCTAMLALLSAGALAAEPAGGPAAELSLELLEFLGEYGNDSGELELPADLDAALVDAETATASQPETQTDSDSKDARIGRTAVEQTR